MSSKEKAYNLIGQYFNRILNTDGIADKNISGDFLFEKSRQCALIAVDEIIENSKNVGFTYIICNQEYWQEVKTEIEKL